MTVERGSGPLPVVLRRSRQLPPWWAALLGVGLWLTFGVFALFDQVVWRAGARSGWAYLGAVLVLVPTLLSHLEVRSWLGRAGGSYGLIKATEQRGATFMAGWLYVLGVSATAALAALTFGRFAASAIAQFVGPALSPTLLAAGLVVVSAVLLLTPYRPRWRITTLVVGAATAYLLVAAGHLLVSRLSVGPAGTPLHVPTGRDFYRALLLLQVGGWALELAARRTRHADVISLLAGAVVGPVLASSLAVLVIWSELPVPTLQAVAENAPGGAPALWLVGALASAAALHILSILMLRGLHEIGQDGLLPERLLQPGARLNAPAGLIGVQALAILASLGLSVLIVDGDSRLSLALWGGAAFVAVQLTVNLATVRLGSHPRAKERPLRLPLAPLIPATGAAICFLLLLALPPAHLLVFLAALAVGAALFRRYGRERTWDAEVGRTIFRTHDTDAELQSDHPVVVSLANPASAGDLAAFAAGVARARGGHVVLVNVTPVGDNLPLAAGRRQAADALALLAPIQDAVEAAGVKAEAVSRLARTPGQGVLDSVEDAGARLLVLGWSVRERPDGHWQLGNMLSETLGRAPCAVAVLRGPWPGSVRSLLVPVGAGPNSKLAAEIGLACTGDELQRVTLLHVAAPGNPTAQERGEQLLADVRAVFGDDAPVTTTLVVDAHVARVIRDAAADHDAVVVGAPEPRLMDPQEIGRLPLRLADESDIPLVLVRRPIPVTTLALRRLWQDVSSSLPSLTSDESHDLNRRLLGSARVSINYFVLILLASVIATLGLLLNSAAVIIGAMLVAPLMGPIVATAGGIATGNSKLLREGVASVVQGALLGVFVAVVTAAVSPLAEPTAEVLARTQPNLLDLLVGVAAGAAGAYVIARREVGEALPGVAIAAALMPPVSVVGIGLALGRFDLAGGALLLFVANLVAIVFASAMVFLLLGIRPPRHATRERQLRRGLVLAVVSLVAISIPLAAALGETVLRSRVQGTIQAVVEEHVATWNQIGAGERDAPVTLDALTVDVGWSHVIVRGTIHAARPIRGAELAALEQDLDKAVPQSVDFGLFAISGQWLKAGEAAPTPEPTAAATPEPTSAPTPESTSPPAP